MNTRWIRLTAVLCSLFLLCQMAPAYAFSGLISEKDRLTSAAETETAEPFGETAGEAFLIGEDTAMREANAKYFRYSDGAYLAAVYSEPVHYPADGGWEEIDNTLESVNGRWETRHNPFRVSLPSTLTSSAPVRLTYGGHTLAFAYQTSGAVAASVTQPKESRLDRLMARAEQWTQEQSRAEQAADGASAQRAQKAESGLSTIDADIQAMSGAELAKAIREEMTALPKMNASVDYPGTGSCAHITYNVSGMKLKESIFLEKPDTQDRYSFFISSDGLTAQLLPDRSVLFSDGDEAVFRMEAPFMWDAAEVYSEDIAVELTAAADGYVYTLTPSAEWLKAPERVYPVTVDPTVEAIHRYGVIRNATGVYAGTVPAELTETGESKYLKVGKKGRYTNGVWGTYETAALLQTDLPSQISKTSRIIGAWLMPKLYVGSKYSTCSTNTRINAYAITGSWSAGTTQAISCSSLSYQSTVIDYIVCNDSTAADGTVYTLDITKAAQQWSAGQLANRGILLRGTGLPTDTTERYARFFSSKYADNRSYCPTFLFAYRDTVGLEGYWTYTTMDAGTYGTAAVNNFNGNPVTVQEICGVDGLRMPVGITIVHNAARTGEDDPAALGSGWRTNFHMQMAAETDTQLRAKYPYYLIDADGTKHYFYKQTDGKLIDEDGLGYTLTVSGTGSALQYTITDKGDGQTVFNAAGRLTDIYDANRYDGNDSRRNRIQVKYNTDGQITRVLDGVGRIYAFAYTDGRLTSITDPAGRVTTFTQSGGRLTRIKYADNRTTQLSYGTVNGAAVVTAVRNAANRRVVLTYTGQGRVQSMASYGSASTLHTKYSFDYSRHNRTVVTDQDGKAAEYQFNNAGQTVGVVDQTSGQAQYYAYGAPGISDAKTALNGAENHLLSASRTQIVGNNLAVNPHFARGGDGYTVYIGVEDQTFTVTPSATVGRTDEHSLCLSQTAGMADLGWVNQDYTGLTPGMYTASVYMYTGRSALTGKGGVLYAEAVNAASGAIQRTARSAYVTEAKDWERVTLSIRINSGEKLRVFMGYDSGTVGSLWIDELQVEPGETDNRYALLENPCMTGGTTGWTGGTLTTVSETVPFGGKALKLTGSPTQKKSITQTVSAKGGWGDVFCFGGWVKASAVPSGTEKTGNAGKTAFRLRVEFYSGNDLMDFAEDTQHTIDFNPAVDGWQFISGQVIAPTYYDSIRFCFDYDYNANTAYLGGCLLYKDNFGQSYTYDENGNVVSTVSLADTQTTFAYQDDRLSKLLNPTGSRYLYTYDENTKTLTYAHSNDGQRCTMTYDVYGNVTSAKINAEKPASALTAGKAYIIRSAKDGSVLSTKGGSLSAQLCTQRYDPNDQKQQWTLVATTTAGTYQLRSVADPTRTFEVRNGSSDDGEEIRLAAYSYGKSAQQYRFAASDEGFIICTTATDMYGDNLCLGVGDKPADKSKGYLKVEQQAISLSDNDRWLIYPVKTQAELDSENRHITTSAGYSSDGNRLQSVTDAYGNTTSYTYSVQKGLLEAVTNASGNKVVYTYDTLGRTQSVAGQNSSGNTLAKVNFSYNADDTLSTVSPHFGNTAFEFAYDEFGRSTTVEVTDLEFARTLVTNRYNSRSLLDRQLYGNGHSVNFVYDALDRLVGKGYNDTAPVFTYGYDLEGRLATANDTVNGIRTRFVYDLAGRLVRTIGTPSGSGGFYATDFSAKYNYRNQVTSRRFGIGSTVRTVEYAYDDTGRLTAENHDGASLSYSFDALGRLGEETVKNGTNTLFRRSFFYTGSGVATHATGMRVLGEQFYGSGWQDIWSHVYDTNGNLTELYKNTATQHYGAYAYDDLNQIATADVLGYTYAYTYDDGGNILTQTKSGLFPTETITYTYGADAWQDLLTGYGGETFTYDEIGNPLTWRNGMTFTWQNGRQLQSAVVGNQSLSFAYNADGIRTQKTVNGWTNYFMLSGNKVIAQSGGVGGRGGPVYFDYDANGHPYSMTYSNTKSFYLCNQYGDVLALLNESGDKIAEYTYGPYGQILSVTGSHAYTLGAINPFRYRGYYYDDETGLYYLNSRYYDPEVGRFINADGVIDPTSVLGTNLYAYCGNNPVMRVDLNGHSWEPALKCIFAITITAVAIAALSAFVVFSGGSGALVVAGMAPQIISAVTYTAAAVGAVAEAVAITGAVTYTTVAVVSEAENIVQAAEHTKNKRPSTKNKHQKGQTRKQRDKLGEKGDARRKNPWGRHRLMMY